MQQPPQTQKIVRADMSSEKGSVTLAVKPDVGVVVTEQFRVGDGQVISGVRLTPTGRKPPAKTYAVIRERCNSSLMRAPEMEASTRSVDSLPAFGRPRLGFTKLKTR